MCRDRDWVYGGIAGLENTWCELLSKVSWRREIPNLQETTLTRMWRGSHKERHACILKREGILMETLTPKESIKTLVIYLTIASSFAWAMLTGCQGRIWDARFQTSWNEKKYLMKILTLKESLKKTLIIYLTILLDEPCSQTAQERFETPNF